MPRALRQRPVPLLFADGLIGLTIEDDGGEPVKSLQHPAR
jgi:hypothetical protein